MRRVLMLSGLVAVGALLAAARPGTEQQLVQQLNGQPVRVVMPDGGAFGVLTVYDAGVLNSFGCAPLTGLRNNAGVAVSANVLVLFPLVPVNVCIMPSANGPLWDGGCNFIPGDMNYGSPMASGIPQYVTPDKSATTICAVSDAGYVSMPIGWAQ